VAIVWHHGLVYQPTGPFGGLGRADRGIAAALQPNGIENHLSVEQVDRLIAKGGHWPIVRRCPSARVTPVRDRGFRSAGRTIMALLFAGEGPRRKAIALDRFDLALVEASDSDVRLDDLLREALENEPCSPDEAKASLRRLANAGAFLVR
jgi:hypothetical protein